MTLPSLLLAVGSLFVGLRLAGFASALSPRGRSLRDSDLKSVVDSHLRLWQWIFGAYLVSILASIFAGLIVSS